MSHLCANCKRTNAARSSVDAVAQLRLMRSAAEIREWLRAGLEATGMTAGDLARL
jgi:hypothetical protein